ncbi:putative ribonuclease H-like domain-containing protein [Tanacetum coccineum]
METSTSTALVSCDGLGGYDSGDQAEEGPNYALMAFLSSSSNSEVSNDSICSKSCLEAVELLKSQNDQLLKDLKKYELMVLGEITIRELRKKLEIVQKEKDEIQLNVDKFEHASKSLNKLIECQIVDNYKKDEFVNKPVVENCKAMSSEEEAKSTPNVLGTQSNGFAGTKASDNAGQARKEIEPVKDYILLLLWTADPNLQVMMERSLTINASGTNEVNVVGGNISIELPFDPKMPALEDDSIFDFSSNDEDDGAVVDMKNLDTTIQEEPKKTLVDLPNGKKAIGTKWVLRNKKDDRGNVIKNKARLGAQGCTQEKEIDYDEVFTPVARIEAIRLFLAYASFKDFVVYQIDVKSAFLYEKIEEEVYVCQPPGFEDLDFPDRVYKVEKKSTTTKGDILLVQVYVEITSVGFTKEKGAMHSIRELMHEKFQISSKENLTFFLDYK